MLFRASEPLLRFRPRFRWDGRSALPGRLRPSALSVLRVSTSSNLIGRVTGSQRQNALPIRVPSPILESIYTDFRRREAELFPTRGVKLPCLSTRSQSFVDVAFGAI